jgi:hypothetical protein
MGAGPIHAVLSGYFYALLIENTDKEKYWILSGETGLKIEKRNIYSLDLAVYLKEKVAGNVISSGHINVAPELVIKINIPVETNQVVEDEHIFIKIQRLLYLGVQKIIWVFSKTKMVLVAEPSSPWQMYSWHTSLELLDKIEFNLNNYCTEVGLQI